ncbi:MAG: hypothetical protein ACK55I_08600, partial [bacterium]
GQLLFVQGRYFSRDRPGHGSLYCPEMDPSSFRGWITLPHFPLFFIGRITLLLRADRITLMFSARLLTCSGK